MDEMKKDLDDFKINVENKFDKMNEKIYIFGTTISSLEGSFKTSELYIKNKFISNDKLIENLANQINELRKEINKNENELLFLKSEFETLRKTIYGKSVLGEGKTIAEKLEIDNMKIDAISGKIDALETSITASLQKLTLLEEEKNAIRKFINDISGKTVYEVAVFSFYSKLRSFIILKSVNSAKLIKSLVNKTVNSIFIKIIVLLLTGIISAPFVQKLIIFIEELLKIN